MKHETVPAYMVAIHHIVLVVANRFHLPIENGYDIRHSHSTDDTLVSVVVSAPKWGPQSYLAFSVQKSTTQEIWYPGMEGYIALEYYWALAPSFRDTCHLMKFRRKPPNTKIDASWYQGTYPRIQVREVRFICKFDGSASAKP